MKTPKSDSSGAGEVKPCNVLASIGKPCRNCGGEIKARYMDRKWALKNRDFCCRRCGALWNAKTRDNAQVTAAMRAASHTPEAQAKRTAGLKNSPKIAAAMAKTASEKAKAEAIRLAATKPCACGCGTEIPTIGVDGTESFWVRGHDKRVTGCKEREKERVPTGTLCVVCETPILARRKEVGWAAKKRHCCSDSCSLVLAHRAVTPEQKARMIEQLKARIAADPRFCAGLGHHGVRTWRLRNPSNVIYEFRNLRLFIMEHEALFAPEDVEWRNAKKGMQCRALYGLWGLSIRRATVGGSWKGWTWHSQTERLKNDGRDLIERKSHSHADLR